MKSTRHINKSVFSLLLAFACFLFTVNVQADTAAKKQRVRMKMYYFKQIDGERLISIALTSGSGKKMHGVKHAEVELTSVLNDSTISLATLETDSLGVIELYLSPDYVLPMDEDGKCILEANYDGDDTYRAASNDIEVKDIELTFDYKVDDSVKYLTIIANSVNLAGEKVPAEEVSISIGVERLYSVLTLDEIETDEDGQAELEISDNIPGDEEGKLVFIANIDDHDEFGTVTASSEYNWGVPLVDVDRPFTRQLFTDEAPLWMIASVCVILLGAWYHFFLSISKLMKLKKEGDTV